MSPFQLVVTGIFVAFILVGIGVFALFGGLGGGDNTGPVTIWGTLPASQMNDLLVGLRSENSAFQEVTYVERNPASYRGELISAMAAGGGPDLFFLSHEDVALFADKVIPIPYAMIPERAYVGAFVEEGRLFLTSQGALALPVLIDPLVMYWNRDLFSAAGVASPPRYWNDFLALAPRLTSLGASSAVNRSAAALGEWQNIRNAKAILSALMMQAGDPIVVRGAEGGLVSVLGTAPSSAPEAPAQSALRFYTEFANPGKTTYSWNRSRPEAQDAFVGGTVGAYFGFASEYKTLQERNPNLTVGVEVLPQIQGGGAALTYGTLTGVAISRSARNPQGAAAVAQQLSAPGPAAYVAGFYGLPSVRRDAQQDSSASAVASVFADSALIARGWLDPSPAQTNGIFQGMIESVSSGRSTPAEAVGDAARLLQQLVQGQTTGI